MPKPYMSRNEPHYYTETGVDYFRDSTEKSYQGWVRLEYNWTGPKGHQGVSHAYLRVGFGYKPCDDLTRLCNHWSAQESHVKHGSFPSNWSYSVKWSDYVI